MCLKTFWEIWSHQIERSKALEGFYHQEFKWAPSSGDVMMIRVNNTNSSSLTHSIFHQENSDSSVHNTGHKPDREIRNLHRRSQMLKISPSRGEDHLTNSPRPLEIKTTLAHYIWHRFLWTSTCFVKPPLRNIMTSIIPCKHLLI